MTTRKFWFSQSSKEGRRNPWVISMIAAIVVVVLVNVVFIVTAVVTSPGLVEDNYYEKGQDHEQNFQKRLAERKRLGWNIAMQVGEAGTPVVGHPSAVVVKAVGRDGAPLVGAKGIVQVYRPSDVAADFQVDLLENRPGVYTGNASFDLIGSWEITATIQRGDNHMELVQRIQVAAAP